MEKDPERRYLSAGQLRDDLRRFLKGEPVQARPISRSARVWRWCKRKPVIASLAAAVASLLVVLAIGGTMVGIHQATMRAEADTAKKQAEQIAESRRRLLYTSDMNLAMQAWNDGNVQQTTKLLRRHVPSDGAARSPWL